MLAEQYPALSALPDEDKLELACELFRDVIGGEETDDPTLESLIAERLADYQAHPELVSPWKDVKARLLALRR